jgi:general secretion pathway protein C
MRKPPTITLRKGLLACTLTLACWLIAHSINAYVAEALLPDLAVKPAAHDAPSLTDPTSGDAMQMAKAILASGLFVIPADTSALDPTARKAAPPPPPPLELAGKLKLLGTAIGDRMRPSAAIETLSDHTQRLYFLQEEIEGFGHVMLITREGVTIAQGNRKGYLPLDLPAENAGMPAIAPALPKRATAPTVIDRRQLKQSLADVSKLLTEARAMPYYNVVGNNGALEGWKLTQIKPKSILDQLGIQEHDIMLRINGTPVTDPSTLLRLLQEIQHEQTVKVDLLRNGEKQTLAYEVR